MKRLLTFLPVVVGATLGCADNPFDRPATLVDGSTFPEVLRSTIAPKVAFHEGMQVPLYLLGDVSAEVGRVVEPMPDEPIEPCLTRQRDENGIYIDTDLEACQGPLFDRLPTEAGYTPYLRVYEAAVPDDYEPNEARSEDQLASTPVATDRVVDRVLVSPNVNIADPANKLPRFIGWYEGLEVIYLEVATAVPLDGDGNVVSMDLLVPEGYAPGDGGDIVTARAGQTGYSPRCRVVTFAVPDGYMPGDIKSAAAVPVADQTPTDQYVHCVAP